jgi:hypothetical protein
VIGLRKIETFLFGKAETSETEERERKNGQKIGKILN